MKIGLITDSIDHRAPGISRYIRNLVRELVKLNENKGYGHEFFLIHERKVSDKLYAIPGIQKIIIEPPKVPLGREIRKTLILKNKLKPYKLDILHDLAQVGPFVFKGNYRAIQTIEDLVPVEFPGYHSFAAHYRNKIGLKLIVKNIDDFIAISNATKNSVIKKYKISPEKIKVIYLAADPIFKRLSGVDKAGVRKLGILKPFLLFVSTIEPRKNIDGLLNAFKIIKKEILDIQLVIVGKQGWKCEKILNDLKNEPGALWLQNVSDDVLVSLYNQAECLVFPSFLEGFGLPVVEAMSCGCPVVLSNTSSMPEVAGDAGFFFNPYDYHDMANKVVRILKDNTLRSNYITKSLVRVQKFSWERCAEQTLKIYTSKKNESLPTHQNVTV